MVFVWKFWKSFLIKVVLKCHLSHIWYIIFSIFRTILPWERMPLQSCSGTCENSTYFFRSLCSQSVEITTLPFLHWFCTPDSTLVIGMQKLTSLRLIDLIPPEKTGVFSGTPGVLRHPQCIYAWVKLRGWQHGDTSPWTYLEVPKATQKLWLLPAFVSCLW